LRRGQRALVRDAAWASVTGSLYGGVILIRFALALGAGPFAIGMLAAIPFIGQAIQLPAIALIERLRQRRKIAVVAVSVARFLILLLAIVPRRRYGHGTDHVAARRAARDHDPRVARRLRAQLVAASTAAARGAWRLFREAALLGNRERLHRRARGWSAHRPLAVRREAARVLGELRRRRSRRLRQRMVSDARARR